MLKSSLLNKKVLDFGCGNGGFLLRADKLAAEVTGVEPEKRVQEQLKELAGSLAPRGRMVVEVPSSEDALLTLFSCDAFQRFTYWSQHLFLFNYETLQTLVEQAGLITVSVQQYQRYPLSNHLHWLSQGKPGRPNCYCNN